MSDRLWLGTRKGLFLIGEAGAGFDPRHPDGSLDWVLVAVRLAGATLVVPVMEELFWRSWLMLGLGIGGALIMLWDPAVGHVPFNQADLLEEVIPIFRVDRAQTGNAVGDDLIVIHQVCQIQPGIKSIVRLLRTGNDSCNPLHCLHHAREKRIPQHDGQGPDFAHA